MGQAWGVGLASYGIWLVTRGVTRSCCSNLVVGGNVFDRGYCGRGDGGNLVAEVVPARGKVARNGNQ